MRSAPSGPRSTSSTRSARYEAGASREPRARAGVLTGEAAVTIGAGHEGMVAGDPVNTASRVQSAAEPGTVYVGETTRRTTEQTVAYADVGSYELKGKEGLTPLWKALRVVSGARGTLRSTGLEAPFVGRDRGAGPDQGSLPRLRGRTKGSPRLIFERLGATPWLERVSPGCAPTDRLHVPADRRISRVRAEASPRLSGVVRRGAVYRTDGSG